MLPQALHARFAAAAVDLDRLDAAVYQAAERDPQAPIFGLGPPTASIAFFGRDPGREEVFQGVPFIGAGGRQLRRVLYQRQYSGQMTTAQQALAAGSPYFWLNTVPYKPIGNKAWSMAVKRRFQPLVAEVMLTLWQGGDVITLGREAFLWFGIHQAAALREQLQHHWQTADRFETSLSIDYVLNDGLRRRLNLHPLPHPSPLNAAWFKQVPVLLEQRLDALEGRR